MTDLKDRLKAFESKLANDEQLAFRIEARTSKLFGLWAAEKIGLDGEDAKTYAGTVVAANLEEKGYQDIIRKVRKDFDEKGIEVSDHVMDVTVAECEEEAKVQIMDAQSA